jgi:thymidylate kinase
MTRELEQQPHIRVMGADTTGKSEVCRAVSELAPQFVRLSETESYVHDWLRTHGVSRSSHIGPEQLQEREQVFYAYNRAQAVAIREVTQDRRTQNRPVVAVRGRADTIITHDVLLDREPRGDLEELFPEGMRPDALVVLTAPIDVIGQRLDARGERKTGANALEFHEKCQGLYVDLADRALNLMPVIIVDTSDPGNTPERIANKALGLVAA